MCRDDEQHRAGSIQNVADWPVHRCVVVMNNTAGSIQNGADWPVHRFVVMMNNTEQGLYRMVLTGQSTDVSW